MIEFDFIVDQRLRDSLASDYSEFQTALAGQASRRLNHSAGHGMHDRSIRARAAPRSRSASANFGARRSARLKK
jgi:hypothetical protein